LEHQEALLVQHFHHVRDACVAYEEHFFFELFDGLSFASVLKHPGLFLLQKALVHYAIQSRASCHRFSKPRSHQFTKKNAREVKSSLAVPLALSRRRRRSHQASDQQNRQKTSHPKPNLLRERVVGLYLLSHVRRRFRNHVVDGFNPQNRLLHYVHVRQVNGRVRFDSQLELLTLRQENVEYHLYLLPVHHKRLRLYEIVGLTSG
jgi:hypothetical protein